MANYYSIFFTVLCAFSFHFLLHGVRYIKKTTLSPVNKEKALSLYGVNLIY